MRTFERYAEVSDMRGCIKRPVTVHAKQINEEFCVNTLEGEDNYGKPGDYLMRDVYGELYVCDKEDFEKLYHFIDKDLWTPWGYITK